MLIKLGHVSHGTVVLEGTFKGRQVAVKRLVREHHDVTLVEREVSLLEQADDHPNVIRCFYHEFDDKDFLFIALALCPASLADFIERPGYVREIADSFDPKRALREITSGLEHLDIVHRNINPENILISSAKEGKSDRYRMVISGFRLCQKLEAGQTSFFQTAGSADGGGTHGWTAPEILRWMVRRTTAVKEIQTMQLIKSVDIFALGCLYYYCLTLGKHPFDDPFDDRFERDCHILHDQKSLQGLEILRVDDPEVVGLIASMLAPEAANRCVRQYQILLLSLFSREWKT